MSREAFFSYAPPAQEKKKMLKVVLMAAVLLVVGVALVPEASASPCGGVVDWTQCVANNSIDTAQEFAGCPSGNCD